MFKTLTIAITGSFKNVDKDLWPEAEEVCKQIGREFAEKKFKLTVGSMVKSTVDYFVLMGFSQIPGGSVEYYSREDSDGEDDKSVAADLNVVKIPIGQSKQTARLQRVQNADLVVAIGGGKGVFETCNFARALSIPFLPIHQFGGGAKDAWSEIKVDFVKAVGTSESQVIVSDWKNGSCKKFVTLCTHVVRVDPYERGKAAMGIYVYASLVIIPLSIVLFAAIQGSLPESFTLYVLFFASIPIGSLTKCAQEDLFNTGRITVLKAQRNFFISLAIAVPFVVACFYLDIVTTKCDLEANRLLIAAIGLFAGFGQSTMLGILIKLYSSIFTNAVSSEVS